MYLITLVLSHLQGVVTVYARCLTNLSNPGGYAKTDLYFNLTLIIQNAIQRNAS